MTASGKCCWWGHQQRRFRNIKALRRLHLLPFTRKQKIIYDLAGLLAYSACWNLPIRMSRNSGKSSTILLPLSLPPVAERFGGASYSYGDSVRFWLTSLLIKADNYILNSIATIKLLLCHSLVLQQFYSAIVGVACSERSEEFCNTIQQLSAKEPNRKQM